MSQPARSETMLQRLTRIESRLVQLMLYLGADDTVRPIPGGIKHTIKDALIELDNQLIEENAE